MTTWFRRWLAGALSHQHSPLPTDDHDDEDDASRIARGHSGPRRGSSPLSTSPEHPRRHGEFSNRQSFTEPQAHSHSNPHHHLQPYPEPNPNPNRDMEDEQFQIDLAIRNSLQEENLRQDISTDDYQLRLAIEISKREAQQAGIVLPEEKPKLPPLPDLLSFDDPPVPASSVPSPSPPPAPASSSTYPDPFAPPSHPHSDSSTRKNEVIHTVSEEKKLKEEQLSLDEAIARSLQEEFESMDMNASQRSRGHGSSSNPHDAENLKFSNHQSNPNSNSIAPSLHPPPNDAFRFIRAPASTCAGCNRPLNPFKFLSCLGKNWHETCFLCQACKKPIHEPQFKVEGDNIPYHSSCHKRLFHPTCAVCNNYIPSSPDGVIRMTSFPPWKEKYCPFHVSDGTQRCTGCKRLEPRGNEFVELEDGRRLCLQCMDSALFTTEECVPLFADIHDFYRSLGLHIRQHIPLLCVETQALNSAMAGESSTHHHQAETRGVCLTEERTISTVIGRKSGLGKISVKQNPVFVQRQAEVTAILVLHALPKLTTGSILAHELMHAWIKLDGGFPPLSGEIEEGICQVMSFLWLQYRRGSIDLEASSSKGTEKSEMAMYQKCLLEYEVSMIKEDSSALYGDGFRAAYASVQKFGLKSTLDHLRLTASLP